MVKIYTRTGDGGDSSLFGGDRVRKDHARLEAYGTLDELNAFLGWFRSVSRHEDLDALAAGAQGVLLDLGAHLATPPSAEKARAHLPEIPEARIEELERAIDALEAELSPLTTFLLPGGAEAASILHVARTVCRRAERRVVAVQDSPPIAVVYLNRLSDLLFVAARVVNKREGVEETLWSPGRP